MKPNVFTYSDFKEFLRDLLEYFQTEKPHFSYRSLAQKAGINSSGFFQALVQGQRKLSEANSWKVLKVLDLNQSETDYFRALVSFNQAKSVEQKDEYFSKLAQLRNRNNSYVLDNSQYDFYDKWYHSVIREIAPHYKVSQLDFAQLAAQCFPAIKAEEAEESYQLLIHHGFLKVEGDNIQVSDPTISSNLEFINHQLIRFQKQMLTLAFESINLDKSYNKQNSTVTLKLSESSFEKAKDHVRGLRRLLLEMAENEENPHKVFQMNMNFFPISRELPSSKG